MQVIIPATFWDFAKWAAVFALFLYIIVSLIVVRQVHLMTQTVKAGLEFPVRLMSYFILIAGIFVFLLAIAIL